MAGRRSARRAGRSPARSQHFLRRGALAASLVARARLAPEDLVVEIGAGRGALTRELARCCRRVVAVEIDPRLCRGLSRQLPGAAVEVVEADFRTFALPRSPYKAFGNLPFHCTSQILQRLVAAPQPPREVFAIVQREAALRYAGSPWDAETRLSLTLKPWWHVEVLTRLPPAAFDPPPRVQCALLWLARREAPLVDAAEARLYRDFVAAAFGRRGERVRDGLKGLLTPRQQARVRRDLPLDLEAPPSALSFDQWLALFRVFAWHADAQARARVRGAEGRLPRRHRSH